MDIFILPSSGKFVNETGLQRFIKSVNTGATICNEFMKVVDFADINKQYKSAPFYGVFYDNEFFDLRLSKAIRSFLIYSRNIDMFVVFVLTKGAKNIFFQPRIFRAQYKLNPDRKDLPLPFNEKELKSEKILDGWLFCD